MCFIFVKATELIFISLLKSAAFSRQTSDDNLKPPLNHFQMQIDN